MTNKGKRSDLGCWLGVLLTAAICAFACTIVYSALREGQTLTAFGTWTMYARNIMAPLIRERFVLFGAVWVYIGLHFLINIRSMYDFLWKYRYLVAVGILMILVLCQFHGSSIGCYDRYLGAADAPYAQPIFNAPRAIRSDEWANNTPNRLARLQLDDPFSPENPYPVLASAPITCSNLFVGWANLSNPLRMIYLFLSAGHAESLLWFGTLIGAFMAMMEWGYLITHKNRLMGFAFACVSVGSSYFQWWSYNPKWFYLLPGILSMMWYFLEYHAFWKRVLLIAGIAMLGAEFVIYMYVPWVIPSGYLFLGMAVWVMIQQKDALRNLRKKDIGLIVGGILFAVSIIAASLYANREYLQTITATVYPGERFYRGGGSATYLLGNMYIQNYALILEKTGNPCEISGMFTLFPIPILLAFGAAIRRAIHRERQNVLQLILLGFTTFYGFVLAGELPTWFMKATLLHYTTSTRLTSVFAWIQVLLLFSVLADARWIRRYRWATAGIASVLSVGLAWCFLRPYLSQNAPQVLNSGMLWHIIAIVLIVSLPFLCVWGSRRAKRILCLIMALFCLVSGVRVHPLMKGLNALYVRPILREVTEIAKEDPQAIWFTTDCGFPVGDALRACGARSICGSQTYPDLEFWHQVDPEGAYEYDYNRWAYVTGKLVEEPTSFLGQADSYRVNINLGDLNLLNIKYIYAPAANELLDASDWILLYQGSDGCIYQNTSV